LPNELYQFTARTGGQFGDASTIARDRTLLRFYRPFLHPAQVTLAEQTMCGSSVAHLKYQLGLLTSRFRANHPLKACLTCMQCDVEEHGWAYWHLCHQFPGVWICPTHGVQLRCSNLKSNGVERFLWHLPAERCLANEERLDAGSQEALRRLATLTQMMVMRAAPDGWLAPSVVQSTLRLRLLERGWITSAGNIRLDGAAASYLYQCTALRAVSELAGLPSDLEQAKSQVGRLMRPLRSGTHPLRLLVTIDWLFDSAAEFITHYASLDSDSAEVIDSQSVNSNVVDRSPSRKTELLNLLNAGMSPTAAAHQIGVTVATAMSWATEGGIRTSHRPKLMKPALRASVVDDLRKGTDKATVAATHHVSIPTVVRVLQTEIGLFDAWTVARAIHAINAARHAWMTLLNEHGALGVKLVRAMNPAIYAWLYRNDRAWLDAHKPIKLSAPEAHRSNGVCWDDRDQELCLAVQQAALTLVEHQGRKPLRLWQIYQIVPALKAKLSVLHRLPLTRRAVELALARVSVDSRAEGSIDLGFASERGIENSK